MEKHISGSQGFGVGVYYNTGLAFGSFGGMKELFHILPRMVITWIYTCVKIRRSVHTYKSTFLYINFKNWSKG